MEFIVDHLVNLSKNRTVDIFQNEQAYIIYNYQDVQCTEKVK